MYRLTITLGMLLAVFVYATVVQSFRLWEVQGEAEALRIAAEKTQKETRKAEADRASGGNGPSDDFWTPAADRHARAEDGEAAEAALTGGVNVAASGKAIPEKEFGSSPGSGEKGVRCKGKPGSPEDAKMDGFMTAAGVNGQSAGGKTVSTNAKGTSGVGKSADGKSGDNKSDSAKDPARAEELVRSAQELIKSGNFDQARSVLQQSLQADSKNTNAWRNLAAVERQLGNFENELSAYQQWAEERPDEKIARYLAAEAFARNGMDDQALQYLADFQAMSSKDPQSYIMAAGIYQQMSMPAEQGDALRKWVAASPASPDAHRVLGDYYQQVGQPDLAISEYQRMASLQPNNPSPYVQLGNAYIQMGQPDAALSQFQTAVNIRPNNVEALGRLAYTQRQVGDIQGALMNYQRIVDIEPGSTAGTQAVRHIENIQGELTAQAQQQAAQK